MWLVVMFDLPVTDRRLRRAYARFRKELLRDGFLMLQLSVYGRYFPSEEAAAAHRARVRSAVPEEGQVRLLTITDHQFGRMEVYEGKRRAKPENPPQQLTLF